MIHQNPERPFTAQARAVGARHGVNVIVHQDSLNYGVRVYFTVPGADRSRSRVAHVGFDALNANDVRVLFANLEEYALSAAASKPPRDGGAFDAVDAFTLDGTCNDRPGDFRSRTTVRRLKLAARRARGESL